MQEPTDIEIEGMMEAGAVGGEYLEAIGKSDLAIMTQDEYLTFIEKVVRAYEHRCMYLYTGGDPTSPPF